MIVAFSHPKGGVGKTTLLYNFCIAEQSKNKDFIVVDLDGQHSATVLNEIRTLSKLKPLDVLTFSKEKELIAYLNENQDKYILIDTGGFDSAFNRIAVAFSDLVIMPISDSPLEQIRAMQDFTKILDSIEKKIKHKINTYVVLNNIHHKNSEKGKKLIKAGLNSDKWKFLNASVSNNSDIKFSLGSGKSLLEYSNKTNAVNEMKAFIKEVRNIIKDL